MVKRCFYRMGYTCYVKEANFSKANLSRPYKFFVHSIIHTMGHRKGGYDVAADYIMCMVAALVLNLPSNFLELIFEQMKANITQEKFLLYPRFIQMLLDDQIPNLAKIESDELPLEHTSNLTLNRLQQYKKQSESSIPKVTRLFGCLKDPNYVAPFEGKWSHDDSESENEDTKFRRFCG
ncbi:hypothetical protein HanOQP8_Chr16g0614861 [Helianthus annuus]|nr:hypothetical protein HanOQP8_Chr16g0614861 [Helianthus annuus]